MPSRIGVPVGSSSQKLLGLVLHSKSKCGGILFSGGRRTSHQQRELLRRRISTCSTHLPPQRCSWTSSHSRKTSSLIRLFSSSDLSPKPPVTSHSVDDKAPKTSNPELQRVHPEDGPASSFSTSFSALEVEGDDAASARAEHHCQLLHSVALEAEQLLADFKQQKSYYDSSTSDTSKSYLQHALLESLGCLMDISRRPNLHDALLASTTINASTTAATASSSTTVSASASSSKLLFHRAFISVLSAAVDILLLDESSKTNELEDDLNLLLLEQALQLARQAQRLNLPMPTPMYQRLSLALAAAAATPQAMSSNMRHHYHHGASAAPLAALLEIAEWQAQPASRRHYSGSSNIIEKASNIDEGSSLTDADSDTVSASASDKLRFLIPALQMLIQRRKYGAVLELLVTLWDSKKNDANNMPTNLIAVVNLDFDVVFDLFVSLKKMCHEHPQDAKEIQRIAMLLVPSALKFLKENKALMLHQEGAQPPQVQAFLARFFLDEYGVMITSNDDVNDEDTDDEDEDEEDHNMVWDPIVIDLILNDKQLLSTEKRLEALSNFYTNISMAMDAKIIQVARFFPPPFASSSFPPSHSNTLVDSDDEVVTTDWSSDEEEGEESDETDIGEIALRREQIYVRGRGRPLDALYFPDVTMQAINLNNGLNLRFTDEYEELIWQRDYQDDDDDGVSMMTLDGDSDGSPYSDDDDDGDAF